MNYDELGHAGPAFEVIGPNDDVVEESIREHPDWTDEQIAAELGLNVYQVASARSRAWL